MNIGSIDGVIWILFKEYRRKLIDKYYGIDRERYRSLRRKGLGRGKYNVVVDTYVWVEYFRDVKSGVDVKRVFTVSCD